MLAILRFLFEGGIIWDICRWYSEPWVKSFEGLLESRDRPESGKGQWYKQNKLSNKELFIKNTKKKKKKLLKQKNPTSAFEVCELESWMSKSSYQDTIMSKRMVYNT